MSHPLHSQSTPSTIPSRFARPPNRWSGFAPLARESVLTLRISRQSRRLPCKEQDRDCSRSARVVSGVDCHFIVYTHPPNPPHKGGFNPPPNPPSGGEFIWITKVWELEISLWNTKVCEKNEFERTKVCPFPNNLKNEFERTKVCPLEIEFENTSLCDSFHRTIQSHRTNSRK